MRCLLVSVVGHSIRIITDHETTYQGVKDGTLTGISGVICRLDMYRKECIIVFKSLNHLSVLHVDQDTTFEQFCEEYNWCIKNNEKQKCKVVVYSKDATKYNEFNDDCDISMEDRINQVTSLKWTPTLRLCDPNKEFHLINYINSIKDSDESFIKNLVKANLLDFETLDQSCNMLSIHIWRDILLGDSEYLDAYAKTQLMKCKKLNGQTVIKSKYLIGKQDKTTCIALISYKDVKFPSALFSMDRSISHPFGTTIQALKTLICNGDAYLNFDFADKLDTYRKHVPLSVFESGIGWKYCADVDSVLKSSSIFDVIKSTKPDSWVHNICMLSNYIQNYHGHGKVDMDIRSCIYISYASLYLFHNKDKILNKNDVEEHHDISNFFASLIKGTASSFLKTHFNLCGDDDQNSLRQLQNNPTIELLGTVRQDIPEFSEFFAKYMNFMMMFYVWEEINLYDEIMQRDGAISEIKTHCSAAKKLCDKNSDIDGAINLYKRASVMCTATDMSSSKRTATIQDCINKCIQFASSS